jgi:sarcosine oxidase subunit alpha
MMRSQVEAGMARRLHPSPSEIIDREQVVRFTFNGRSFAAYEGDTIASALAAAGITTFSRSFKYHRRRGLMCVAGNCSNCLVQVGDEPNVRSCVTPVEGGMVVTTQNAWPSLERDVMSLTQRAERFLPAGFYYRAFMRPKALWPLYERMLRRATGLGRIQADTEPRHPEKVYKHADVVVIGGGPAGLRAAQVAAQAGARVVVMEAEAALGGHLRWATHAVCGQPAFAYIAALADEVAALENVEVLTDTTVFGCYEQNWIAAVQGDRLIKMRARAVVVATGAYESPALFENNDLPGVMLGTGAQRLVRLWGVRPGGRAVVASANRRGLQVALELADAGMEIAAVAELRAQPDEDLAAALAGAHITLLAETTVAEARGRRGVEGVRLRSLRGDPAREVACDVLAVSHSLVPANELLFQAGGRLTWDDTLNVFVPSALPAQVFAAGEVAATHDLTAIEREGELAGLQAALAAGFGGSAACQRAAVLAEEVEQQRRTRSSWAVTHLQAGKHDFVCFCEDVTRKDVRRAMDEGYDSIELLKRYSTISMGPCQGRMCGMNAMHLCADHNGQSMAITGTTTARPPVRPVAMDTLAGRPMEPVRLTPLHEWHVAHGATMMNAGLWKRPEHYGDPAAEARAVRERVGLIDVSTLGKLQLSGPDVAALLERIYTNRWRNLEVGRARYGVMTNDEGVVIDDGVTARLADDLYYMTTTSSGATGVYEWIEWWMQSGWPFEVHVLNVTDLRAAMNLTGPRAREVLAKVVPAGVDVSNAAFPYMHARQALVAGVPAIMLRIGFTGELGYEIHVPGGYGLHVWQALLDAGAEYGIRPFGVEAQRVLRLEKGHIIVGQETDALTNPFEVGAGWAVKLDKDDFLGKPSLVVANERGVEKRLVGFEMQDLPEEMCQIVRPGNGPLGLEIIGRITSVRRSPTLDKVIGLCWLPAVMAEPGQTFTVRVRGELRTGQVVDLPFYDPDGAKLRA